MASTRRWRGRAVAAVSVVAVYTGSSLMSEPAHATSSKCERAIEEELPERKFSAVVRKAFEVTFRIPGLSVGDTYEDWVLSWGDGTEEPASVHFRAETEEGCEEATVEATHTYAAPGGVQATLSGFDTTRGGRVERGAIVWIEPAFPTTIGRVRVARAGHLRTEVKAAVDTGEDREISQLKAELEWGRRRWLAAKLTGSGKHYEISASHRWRRPGRYTVTVKIADEAVGATYRASRFSVRG